MKEDEQRRSGRERCYGKVFFVSSKDVPGYIRDISSEGLRVECPLPLSPETKKSFIHTIRVLPDEDAVIEPFTASVEIRWLQRGDIYLILGLRIREMTAEAENEYKKILEAYKAAHSSEEG